MLYTSTPERLIGQGNFQQTVNYWQNSAGLKPICRREMHNVAFSLVGLAQAGLEKVKTSWLKTQLVRPTYSTISKLILPDYCHSLLDYWILGHYKLGLQSLPDSSELSIMEPMASLSPCLLFFLGLQERIC